MEMDGEFGGVDVVDGALKEGGARVGPLAPVVVGRDGVVLGVGAGMEPTMVGGEMALKRSAAWKKWIKKSRAKGGTAEIAGLLSILEELEEIKALLAEKSQATA